MGDYWRDNYILKFLIEKYAVKETFDNPKVSIIVPTFNSEQNIQKCLTSLIKQTLKEIEIIVIDEGSTDYTSCIVSVFASEDKRIKYISQENAGFSNVRNEGLKIAKGEYISFINSKNCINEKCYKKLYTAIEKNKSETVAKLFFHKSEDSKFPQLCYIKMTKNIVKLKDDKCV